MKGGPSRAPQRSLLRALGLSDTELTRPFIGVVCSKSDYIPGHKHLGEIAEAVKAGIRNAEFRLSLKPLVFAMAWQWDIKV